MKPLFFKELHHYVINHCSGKPQREASDQRDNCCAFTAQGYGWHSCTYAMTRKTLSGCGRFAGVIPLAGDKPRQLFSLPGVLSSTLSRFLPRLFVSSRRDEPSVSYKKDRQESLQTTIYRAHACFLIERHHCDTHSH